MLTDYARDPAHAAEAQPLLVLADYYVRGNQFEKAEAASREALQRAEGATPPDLKTAVDIRLRLAEFLSRFGRHDDALAAIDTAKTGEGSSAAELNELLFASASRCWSTPAAATWPSRPCSRRWPSPRWRTTRTCR